jgi:aminoglycoside phosphotransferase (APT) family kinase protein
MARMDVEARRGTVLERLEALRAQGLLAGIGDIQPWREIAETMPAGLPSDGPVLVHGDLYARHVLVDGAGAPCGVIDWGDVHLGDPAIDLSLACGFLPAAARDLFRAEYGPIAGSTWEKARFRALFSAVAILFYGADVGDADLVREGRAALRNVLS